MATHTQYEVCVQAVLAAAQCSAAVELLEPATSGLEPRIRATEPTEEGGTRVHAAGANAPTTGVGRAASTSTSTSPTLGPSPAFPFPAQFGIPAGAQPGQFLVIVPLFSSSSSSSSSSFSSSSPSPPPRRQALRRNELVLTGSSTAQMFPGHLDMSSLEQGHTEFQSMVRGAHYVRPCHGASSCTPHPPPPHPRALCTAPVYCGLFMGRKAAALSYGAACSVPIGMLHT